MIQIQLMSQPVMGHSGTGNRPLELMPMEVLCPLMLTTHCMRGVPEQGMYFRKHDSLQLRDIPKEEHHCDPSAAHAPGSWRNEHIDP